MEKIPNYGSIQRPAGPKEGIEELQKGLLEWRGGDIEIEYETDEFTSVCPTTGQPDFNTIKIGYIPDKLYIESKSMKFYLWAFREFGIHCEYLADKLCSELKEVTKAKSVEVTVMQKARGGIKLKSTCKL
jgi:7-cyano-7-deazaguanine reductase